MPVRITILNYTGDRGNWGSQATSEELLGELREVFGTDTTFHLVPIRKSNYRETALTTLTRSRIRKALTVPLRQPSRLLLESAKWLYGSAVDEMDRSDLVVFQSEGTMDETRFSTSDRLLLLPYVARTHQQKPVIALNGSAVAQSAGFQKTLTNVYASFHRVEMREPISAELLTKNGVPNVIVNPDSAFLTQAQEIELLTKNPYICVTGSAVLRESGWENYFATVEKWAKSQGLDVVLLLSGPADIKTLWNFERTDRGIYRVPTGPTYGQIAHILSQAQLLVGGRYHMSILSATQGTPFVAMPSGSHKSEGLQRLLGLPETLVTASPEEGLTAALQLTLDQRATRSEHLKAKVEEIRSAKQRLRADWAKSLPAYFGNS